MPTASRHSPLLCVSLLLWLAVLPSPSLLLWRLWVWVLVPQSVSGTLAMALAAGAPCLSTPYPFAAEMLRRNDSGVLVPFRDSEALAERVVELLADPVRMQGLSQRAYALASTMTWRKVAEAYVQLAMVR